MNFEKNNAQTVEEFPLELMVLRSYAVSFLVRSERALEAWGRKVVLCHPDAASWPWIR
jgi:hypothetical protein